VELVTEFLEILGNQTKIIDQLANQSSSKNVLVDKNIIKSPNSTFGDSESSKLNNKEKYRTKEASSIFISKFFEEQKKIQKDTKDKTLVTKIAKPVIKQKTTSEISGKSAGGWLSKLFGLLGLGSLLDFNKLKELFMRGVTKLFSKFKGILSKIWTGVKKLFSRITSSIGRFFGKLWSGIKGIGSKIWNSKFVKGFRGMLANAWSKLKGVFGYMGNKVVGVFKSIGRSISGLSDKITNSKAYKAFSGLIDDAISAISNLFSSIKDKIGKVIGTAVRGIKSLLPEGVKTAASGVKSVTSKVASGVKSVTSKGVKSVTSKVASGVNMGLNATKKVVSTAVGGVKSVTSKVASGATSVVSGVKSVGKGAVNMGLNAAKKVVSTAAGGVIKASGGMFKLMGKLTAKGAAKIPIIGPAIEGVLATMDIKAMKKKGMPDSQLQQEAGKRVITGVSGMIGSAGGAALAGTLGSIVPGAGTAIGAILGAMVGDLSGRFLGGLITDYIIPKKYTKTIGAFVTGTTPPKDEMQDFIIKDGKVHKFNKNDEVMGLKTGGAINEFLRGNGNNETMKHLIKANMITNQYLKHIAHNTSVMARSSGSNGSTGANITVVQPSQQSSSKQMTTIPNNRDGYLTSAYALG